MGRILAIDYGRKRVGIAVTDEHKIIATPLGTVAAHDILDYLRKYIATHDVECFVVGEPKQMDNTASESSLFIEPFIRRLKSEFKKIPVKRMDERFTSLIASRTIREAGLKKKDRQNKSLVDSISATLILQSYLERRR